MCSRDSAPPPFEGQASGYLDNMTLDGELDLAILFNESAFADLNVEPPPTEEFYLVVVKDRGSSLLTCQSLNLAEAAQPLLVLPRPVHDSRRRFAMEFERANLTLHTVSEIDSLHFLMQSVADGLGATIQPIAATYSITDETVRWRSLPISDINTTRDNYLCALPAGKLSPLAEMVRSEIRQLAPTRIEGGEWRGVWLPSAQEG